MPPCYSIEITFTKDKIVNGFVEKIYNTIFESGFHFKSGYGFAEHMTLKKIIKVNQDKLTKGFKLGFTQHVKHDYKQMLLDTSLYSEMRIYWILTERKVNLNLIIPEDDLLVENTGYTPIEENGVTMIELDEYYKNVRLWQNKISPIINIAGNLWNSELPSMIQSGRDLYHGGNFIKELDEGGLLCINPFCIVKTQLYERFKDRLSPSVIIEKLCNDGFLVIDESKIRKGSEQESTKDPG